MKVHRPRSRWIVGAVASLCLAAFAVPTGVAAEPAGIWKLVVLAMGEDDFAILDLHRRDGKARGVLLDGRKGMFDKAQVEDVELADGKVGFTLKAPAATLTFEGDLAKEGPEAGRLLGTISFRENVFPARLEKTNEERIGPQKPGVIGKEYFEARNKPDPKARVEAFRGMVGKLAGSPVAYVPYTEILDSAGEAGLSAADVDSLLSTWRKEAAPYGPAWLREVDVKALGVLASQKPFAATALKLGQGVEKALPDDAPTETRQSIARLVAESARNAGAADVAAEAEGRVARLEAQLDEEYHEKVPPFQATPYAGPKSPDAGRPVVMELFTGAQCPPCVAADVAFDGLLKAYEPTAFIGLQYHLDIPAPDPLTSPDAIARQEYYRDGVRGTPSVFFNGRVHTGGGGPMAASEAKYQEYRGAIDPILEERKQVDVSVSASRTGDEIAIVAEAALPSASKEGAAKAGKSSSVKIRLALTEESVRYVGGNRLRFHHHVVRALPGGAQGTALVDGRGKVEVKVNLAELRKTLEGYVAERAEERPFFGVAPAVALENLSVVAFVQDDLDKSILGAATAPATTPTP
jgi:hypothetical protein